MDKNEEFQNWLNDERYVRPKDLKALWNVNQNIASKFLYKHKILPVKTFNIGRGGCAFYDKQQCINARAIYLAELQELQKCLSDINLIQSRELALKWGISQSVVSALLSVKNIKPIKTFYCGRSNHRVFYDRAECERARPFINQPEKKEVEKVENIGELATATKHQILCETGADGFIWDKVTMKHKIMPVKNYCDERGNFIALFKKDETVSAILEYKNEQKKLLEKYIADKNLVTAKQLADLWNLDKAAVYSKIYRLKIKPYAKIKLENSYMQHFYKKSDCIESQTVEKVEEKQMELPEPKEQTPDIIPADTIDLFTMSELESELKKRGIELTVEVRAKINASDMPEMQHIAKMLRGNTKTIAIRLSVLNEIAGQLKCDNADIREDSKISMNVHTQDGHIERHWLNTELRPCILCGGDKLVVDAEESHNDNWHASVLCCKCGDSSVCADDSNLHDVMDSLIDNWQMRHHAISAPKKKSRKGIGGAKGKYDENFPVLAKEYARQGATDKAISEYLGISQDTFYRYCKEYPLFAKALIDGRSASPFDLNGLEGKSASERYLLLMQQQLNGMQKMIEMLVKKLDGVEVVEKKIYMKNNKVDKVVVTETKLK